MISRATTYIRHRCVFRRSLQSALQLRVQSTGTKFLADGLLRRAQKLSNEHSELEKQLMDSYDKKLATRAGQLASVSRALREYQDAIVACSLSLFIHY
ncbi:hypothetical protein HOY80DRAFT_884000 [Tuber brumale]|nr:hypothetical protein HOY80DRAFT_884000 [Tuber brumale]